MKSLVSQYYKSGATFALSAEFRLGPVENNLIVHPTILSKLNNTFAKTNYQYVIVDTRQVKFFVKCF